MPPDAAAARPRVLSACPVAALSALSALSACPEPEPEPEPPPRVPVEFRLPDGYAPGAGRTFPGLAGIPNVDDDDRDGQRDWRQGGKAAGDDDRVAFQVPAASWDGLPEGDEIRLELISGTGRVRIWREGAQVLGETESDNLWTTSLLRPAGGEDLEFQVEWRTFRSASLLALRRYSAAGDVVEEDLLHLTAAPLVLNHHLQANERAFVVAVDWGGSWNNDAMIETYGDVLGDGFEAVPGNDYGGDVWIQDEIQLATLTAPGQRMDFVIDLIRDRPLDPFAEDWLEGPGFALDSWGNPKYANSYDYGGNLEVSPPVTAAGVDYPFGRVYWGNVADNGPDPEMLELLEEQAVQAPFYVDTSWLCVGHIDEYTSVVPDPASPKGFRFVITDGQAAWDVLEAMDPALPLPRYAGEPPWDGHGIADVGAFLDDAALRAMNEEIQEDVIEPNLAIFREKLGLDDEDIVRIPGLWEEPFGCGGYKAALIPGMVNLIVAETEGGTEVFLADPFLRDGDGPDAMQEAVRAAFPAGLELNFVDDWFVYHMGLGEVHCATNEIETPMGQWWTDAVHLLVEEEG